MTLVFLQRSILIFILSFLYLIFALAEVCAPEVSEGKLEVAQPGQPGWQGVQRHQEQVFNFSNSSETYEAYLEPFK